MNERQASNAKPVVRVLHLEDSAIDAELICEFLNHTGAECDVHRVWTRDEFVGRLSAAEYDLILADHQLPAFDGEAALEIARELAPQIPFVFVSGTLGEHVAVESMKRGATDYVIKQRLDRLPDVVTRALGEAKERAERRRAEAGLRASEDRYRSLFNAIPQGFCVIQMVFDDAGEPVDYIFMEMNAAFESQTGLRDALGRSVRSLNPDHEKIWFEVYGEIATTGVSRRFEEPSATLGRHFSVYAFRIGDPAQRQVAVLFEDIGERAAQERRLRNSEGLYRFLHQLGKETGRLSDADAILATTARMIGEHLAISNCAYADMDEDQDGFTIRGDWAAPGSRSIVGRYSLAAFGRLAVQELRGGRALVVNDNVAELAPEEARTFQAIGIAATVCVPLLKEGRLVALMAIHDKVAHHWTQQELVAVHEVAERSWAHIQRVRTEAELRDINATLEQRIGERTAQLMAAEEALRQAQKMEAIGQLTGGLAHDFNNLLTAVTGGLELLQTRLAQGRYDQLDRYVDMAQSGARRAAALTQRLLAFSRRQTLAPTVTDIDQLAAGMREIIDRTLGPSIEFNICGTQGLWPTMVDGPQVENSLLNLCINARDAMPDGGSLTIETANVSLDPRAAASQGLQPGDYVSLCVTDTGTGIPQDVVGKVFEPFFTTKPLGQGTGLGLSMIYGFTQQSGGQVRIYSEVGRGTTVCMYLPRYTGTLQPEERPAAPAGAPRSAAGETVLVVEDEPAIRKLLAEVLEEAGYRVLVAADGPKALATLQAPGTIDLLITDVGLPGGLNGRQVADAARSLRPGLKTLFITGYAANAAVGAGHLEAGMEVLTKPFNVADLEGRVRAMLDRAEGQRPGSSNSTH